MKNELKQHLLPLIIIFVFVSIIWILLKVQWYEFIYLFVGLGIGSFFLDFDHIIYWMYLNPRSEESRLAQIAVSKRDFDAVTKLLAATSKSHTSLIFHHFFFQVVLALISVFVFTSSGNTFGMSFLLALNIHLLVDEYQDYRFDKEHLQDWLFARESKQLPLNYLGRYLLVFASFTLFFAFLLLKSKP